MSVRVFIAGQKSFGAAVYKRLKERNDCEIVGVACPNTKHYDKLKKAAFCDRDNKPIIIDAEKLLSSDIPDGTDILIAAHSHHYVSSKVCARVKLACGYHPSLLPRHRGRDAVKWTIHMRDSITGGTVYKLNDKVDGGDIILQDFINVAPSWTHHELWRVLFPLGVDLIDKVVSRFIDSRLEFKKQEEVFATWEPSFDSSRLYRPELPRLS